MARPHRKVVARKGSGELKDRSLDGLSPPEERRMEIRHMVDRLQPLGNGRECIGNGCARVQYEPGLPTVDVHIDRNIPHKADGRRYPPHALGRTADSNLPARKVNLDTGPAENVHADKAPDPLPYLLRQIFGVNVIKRNGCRNGKPPAVKVDAFRLMATERAPRIDQQPPLAIVDEDVALRKFDVVLCHSLFCVFPNLYAGKGQTLQTQ